jgi:hypothetical protein
MRLKSEIVLAESCSRAARPLIRWPRRRTKGADPESFLTFPPGGTHAMSAEFYTPTQFFNQNKALVAGTLLAPLELRTA